MISENIIAIEYTYSCYLENNKIIIHALNMYMLYIKDIVLIGCVTGISNSSKKAFILLFLNSVFWQLNFILFDKCYYHLYVAILFVLEFNIVQKRSTIFYSLSCNCKPYFLNANRSSSSEVLSWLAWIWN